MKLNYAFNTLFSLTWTEKYENEEEKEEEEKEKSFYALTSRWV